MAARTMEGENAHPNRSPATGIQSQHQHHSLHSGRDSFFRPTELETKTKTKAMQEGLTLKPPTPEATSVEASPLQRFDPYQDAYTSTSSSGSSNYSGSKSQRNRGGGGILRDGERMESLFGLHKASTAEYWQLCRTVTDASTRCPSLENHTHRGAPCPCLSELTAWRRILEICSLAEAGGVDLLRLHRRATARLAPFLTYEPTGTETTGTSEEDSSRQTELLRDHLLHIWLSFAAAQRRYGKVDEARWTLRHLHTLHLGIQSAAFYLAQAHVAESDEAARDIIQIGIYNKAEPANELSRALRHWREQIITARSTVTIQSKKSGAPSAKRLRTELDYRPLEIIPKASSNRERPAMDDKHHDSDMSLETPTLDTETSGAVKPTSLQKSSATTKPLIRFDLPPRIAATRSHAAYEKFELPSLGGTSLASRPIMWTSSLSPQPPTVKTDETTGTPTKTTTDNPLPFISGNIPSNNINTTNRTEKMSGLPTSAVPQAIFPLPSVGIGQLDDKQPSKRLNLATSKPGLTNPFPLQLSSGGALSTKFGEVLTQRSNKKVNGPLRPNSSSQRPPLQLKSFKLGKAERIDQSTIKLDPDDVEAALSTKKNDIDKTPTRKPSKSVKLDLEYMWNWDPEKRLATSSTETPNDHDREGQTPSISLSSSSVNVSTATNSSSCSKETSASENSGANRASQRRTECDPPSLRHHPKEDGSQISTTTNGSREKQAVQPEPATDAALQVNADFLPLVREHNMLRVNNVPYAKLKIIGKGGSCKVYCALSQTLDVVAIKRVKLDGLDEKAIAGYSNEIALLKRLEGNSTIIQLHDSEVDNERRVIHLVMELGEVDLNHVLQKQQTSRGLNMNFIRMTWQQMLKAVHSIHEERIIHGDLKPANFLFVRGSLKLIDFGIAKAMQNDDTTNIYRENQIGTLNYMSPEAILDSGASADGQSMKCGRASDIWSLGCILYQMIYGKTPFADLHMILKLQAIVNPNHQIKYPSGVDESAIDAVKRCLQRNPSDRSPIVHDEIGLLNVHVFLNGGSK